MGQSDFLYLKVDTRIGDSFCINRLKEKTIQQLRNRNATKIDKELSTFKSCFSMKTVVFVKTSRYSVSYSAVLLCYH